MLRLLCVSTVFCVHWTILDFSSEGLQCIYGSVLWNYSWASFYIYIAWLPTGDRIQRLERFLWGLCKPLHTGRIKTHVLSGMETLFLKKRILSKFPSGVLTHMSLCTLHYLKNSNLQARKEISFHVSQALFPIQPILNSFRIFSLWRSNPLRLTVVFVLKII